MRTVQMAGLVLASIAVLALGCAPTTEEADPAEVRAAIEAGSEAWGSAANAGDAAGVAALYTDDGQIFPPNAEPATGRQAIEEVIRAELATAQTWALHTLEVEVCGDTAYEVGHFQLMDQDGGLVDEGNWVAVWKQQDGEWRLHRDIWNTNIPAPTGEVGAGAEGAG